MTRTLLLWQPGIGDPTWLGWMATLLHLWAGALCVRAWRVGRGQRGQPGSDNAVWLALGTGLLFLSINKQLDLQTALIETGRELARTFGLLGERRLIQRGFVIVLCAATGVVAVWGVVRFRGFVAGHPSAAVGAVLLALLLLVRAAAEDHVQRLWGISTSLPMGRWILEFGGAGLLAASAVGAGRPVPATVP